MAFSTDDCCESEQRLGKNGRKDAWPREHLDFEEKLDSLRMVFSLGEYGEHYQGVKSRLFWGETRSRGEDKAPTLVRGVQTSKPPSNWAFLQ